jgi:hypothetical protein
MFEAIESLLKSGEIRKTGTVLQYSPITKQNTEISTYEKINSSKKIRRAPFVTPKKTAPQPTLKKTPDPPHKQPHSLNPMPQNQKTENKCLYCETTYTGLLCPKCVNCETQYLGAQRCLKCNKPIPKKNEQTKDQTQTWRTETKASTSYW